jgi:hypothetical protein
LAQKQCDARRRRRRGREDEKKDQVVGGMFKVGARRSEFLDEALAH